MSGDTLIDPVRNLGAALLSVSVSDPLVSLIEGVISRGDAETALLIEEAWRRGCRLHAWQDSIRKDIWLDIFAAHPVQVSRVLHGWGAGEGLPWDCIKGGVQAITFPVNIPVQPIAFLLHHVRKNAHIPVEYAGLIKALSKIIYRNKKKTA